MVLSKHWWSVLVDGLKWGLPSVHVRRFGIKLLNIQCGRLGFIP
jgi:hypothetical protein